MNDSFDYVARQAVKHLEQKLEQRLELQREIRSDVSARIDFIESVLGHNLLMLHALISRLIEQGVVSREQLVETARELDAADGAADGEIDLNSTLPAEKRRHQQTIHDLFRHLKGMPSGRGSPLDFLRDLEQRDLEQRDLEQRDLEQRDLEQRDQPQ